MRKGPAIEARTVYLPDKRSKQVLPSSQLGDVRVLYLQQAEFAAGLEHAGDFGYRLVLQCRRQNTA